MESLKRIFSLLETNSKKKLPFLIFLSIFISVIETIGISSIMPFIDVATNFAQIESNKYYFYIYQNLGFDNKVDYVITFGIILIFFHVFRGAINWFYIFKISQFEQYLYATISKKILSNYLLMHYRDFLNTNKSQLTKSIVADSAYISSTINAVLVMISEIFVILFLYILLLFTNWQATIVFSLILTLMIFFLTQTVSKRIKTAGNIRVDAQRVFFELLSRIFSNFKYIKLLTKPLRRDLEGSFAREVNKYSRSNITNSFLAAFPKIFLETSGFILIILFLVLMLFIYKSNVSHILPTLSLFVLALYRLMPSVNRIVNGYNTLMYNHKSIGIVSSSLNIAKEELNEEKVNFLETVELDNINFSFNSQKIFENVSLKINKGDKVAIIGESGAGKSTLIDILIGLHIPKNGTLKIDGIVISNNNLQSWRGKIGYIPQNIYLFDGTIAENVCFGRGYDEKKLIRVLDQAKVTNFIKNKNGINTLVGDSGIQLSGGQKQRVGIARALYGNPQVLILDEATSSLDSETESKIMNEIYSLVENQTLIIIAHRLSTIDRCNKVYFISNGKIVEK